jgi:hypothetical protein
MGAMDILKPLQLKKKAISLVHKERENFAINEIKSSIKEIGGFYFISIESVPF